MSGWHPKAEVSWKQEPEIEAARKLPGWGAFHRACGVAGFAFDHPSREGGRRGTWACDCFTTVKDRSGHYQQTRLSVGRGATVLEAMADAHEKSGRATAETRAAFDAIAGKRPPVDDDFDALLGGAESDDFEELLR